MKLNESIIYYIETRNAQLSCLNRIGVESKYIFLNDSSFIYRTNISTSQLEGNDDKNGYRANDVREMNEHRLCIVMGENVAGGKMVKGVTYPFKLAKF